MAYHTRDAKELSVWNATFTSARPDCQDGTGPVADHHRRHNLILSRLDEQQRRWVAAAEAQRFGYGGFNVFAAITGMHPAAAGMSWPPT